MHTEFGSSAKPLSPSGRGNRAEDYSCNSQILLDSEPLSQSPLIHFSALHSSLPDPRAALLPFSPHTQYVWMLHAGNHFFLLCVCMYNLCIILPSAYLLNKRNYTYLYSNLICVFEYYLDMDLARNIITLIFQQIPTVSKTAAMVKQLLSHRYPKCVL